MIFQKFYEFLKKRYLEEPLRGRIRMLLNSDLAKILKIRSVGEHFYIVVGLNPTTMIKCTPSRF